MKKYLFILTALLFTVPALADGVGVEVRPEVVARMYDGADQALGSGVNVDVKGLFPNENIVAITGFEAISTEVDSRVEGADVDIVSSKIAIGYDYDVIGLFTARPYVGLDFAFINGEDSKSKNKIGQSIGLNVSRNLSDRVSAFLGLGYQFLDTRIGADKVDLSNFNWKSGISVKF